MRYGDFILALLCYEKYQKLCVKGKSCKYFQFLPKATKLNEQFFVSVWECVSVSVCLCVCVCVWVRVCGSVPVCGFVLKRNTKALRNKVSWRYTFLASEQTICLRIFRTSKFEILFLIFFIWRNWRVFFKSYFTLPFCLLFSSFYFWFVLIFISCST